MRFFHLTSPKNKENKVAKMKKHSFDLSNQMSYPNVYILELENNKYYVGKSNDPVKRFQQHLAGKGSCWTKLHKPILIQRIIASQSDFDEDKYTKELMAIHGIDNVRGGSYPNMELDNFQKKILKREIRMSTNKCIRCGRSDHFIKSCDYSSDIDGNRIPEKKKRKCERCGRNNHFVEQCYAKYSLDGKNLNSNDENEGNGSYCSIM